MIRVRQNGEKHFNTNQQAAALKKSSITLRFIIVAVIVCALAFTACFFALEMSRVNKHNITLNNSISQNSNNNVTKDNLVGSENISSSGQISNTTGETISAVTNPYITIKTYWFNSENLTYNAAHQESIERGNTSGLFDSTSKMWLDVGGETGYEFSFNASQVNNLSKLRIGTKNIKTDGGFIGVFVCYNNILQRINSVFPGFIEEDYWQCDISGRAFFEFNKDVILAPDTYKNVEWNSETLDVYVIRSEIVNIYSLSQLEDIYSNGVEFNNVGLGGILTDYSFVMDVTGQTYFPTTVSVNIKGQAILLDDCFGTGKNTKVGGYILSSPLLFNGGVYYDGSRYRFNIAERQSMISLKKRSANKQDLEITFYCEDYKELADIVNNLTWGYRNTNNCPYTFDIDLHGFGDSWGNSEEINWRGSTVNFATTSEGEAHYYAPLRFTFSNAHVNISNSPCVMLTLKNCTYHFENNASLQSLTLENCTSSDEHFSAKVENGLHLNNTTVKINSNGKVNYINIYENAKVVFENTSIYSVTINIYSIKAEEPSIIDSTAGVNTYLINIETSVLLAGTYNLIQTNNSLTASKRTINYKHGSNFEILEDFKNSHYITYIKLTNIYEINSYYGLTNSIEWLSKQSTFMGTYLLTCDITIPNGFTGIGSAEYPFNAIFDGNGYCLTFESGACGLFRDINNATIKNLIIDGTINNGASWYGANGKVNAVYSLACSASGSINIYNIYMNATIKQPEDTYYNRAAGLIAEYVEKGEDASLTIKNCKVTGAISIKQDVGGGGASCFVGYYYKDGTSNIQTTINFANCVAVPRFSLSAYNGIAYGAFVADNLLDDSKLSFKNCYIEGVYLGYGEYEYHPAVWPNSVGSLEDGAIKNNITNAYSTDSDLNTWVDEINIKESTDFYNWYNGYFITHEIADSETFNNLASSGDFKLRSAVLNSSIGAGGDIKTSFDIFAGAFNGNGNSITFTNATQGFAKILQGQVDNLTIKGSIINADSTDLYLGAIAGKASSGSVINNCTNEATIKVANGSLTHVGGIVGFSQSSDLKNLTNNIFVQSNESGITVSTSTTKYIGGIIGQLTFASSTYSNLKNYAKLTTTVSDAYVGGIIGKIELSNSSYLYINNCSNFGDINAVNSISVGGIIGFVNSTGEIYINLNQENNGNITGTNYVGGIFGYYAGSEIYATLNNSGGVKGKTGVGGIIGYNTGTTFKNAVINNSGSINALSESSQIGGIVGYTNKQLELDGLESNSINITIPSNNCTKIGGVVGECGSENTSRGGLHTGTITFEKGVGDNCGVIAGYMLGEFVNCQSTSTINITGDYTSFKTGVGYGNITNYLFNGVIYQNSDVIDLTTLLITGSGTATKCFIRNYTEPKTEVETVSNEQDINNITKILTSETNGVSYVNCSTFKYATTSLVWNGSYFGYVNDAFSDGTTFYEWVNGYLVKNSATAIRDTTLDITEIDNLNAINDLIITKEKDFYPFVEKFTFKDSLDLSEFEGIGNLTYAFVGDGLNCLFNMEENVHLYLGESPLFNNIQKTTIEGLIFENAETKTLANSPILNAQNCTITNCVNNAIINSANQYVGGIVGSANGCTITNCENNGEITSTISANGYAGGVVGNTLSTTTIESCVNNGKITNTQGLSRLGGIVGNSQSGTIIVTNCENYGEIYNGGSAGGIIGGSYGGTISNCYVNCNILSRTNAGGIVGLTTGGTTTIVNCITEGIIDCLGVDGYARVSGVVGRANVACTINNCISFAKIINQLNQATTSGIVNNVSTESVVVNNCYFFGGINSTQYSVIASGNSITTNNCGYNMNNVDVNVIGSATVEDNGAQLIYVKNNPVWSANAYIKLLFKTERESLLTGTNTKLALNWESSHNFDMSFWEGL